MRYAFRIFISLPGAQVGRKNQLHCVLHCLTNCIVFLLIMRGLSYENGGIVAASGALDNDDATLLLWSKLIIISFGLNVQNMALIQDSFSPGVGCHSSRLGCKGPTGSYSLEKQWSSNNGKFYDDGLFRRGLFSSDLKSHMIIPAATQNLDQLLLSMHISLILIMKRRLGIAPLSQILLPAPSVSSTDAPQGILVFCRSSILYRRSNMEIKSRLSIWWHG